VVISNENLDRYKERVLVTSFKKTIKDFMEHPVMLSSHSYRGLMSQIGEYTKIKIDEEAKEVIAYPKWYVNEGNPEADWGWKLAEKGIAAFSIGFIPKKFKDYDTDEERKESKGSRRDYEEIELLESSQVLIPALPSALQRSFDAAAEGEEKDFWTEIMDLYKEFEASQKKDGAVPDVVEEGKKKPKEDDDDDEDDKGKGEVPPEKTTEQRLRDVEIQVNATHLMLVDVKAYILKLLESKGGAELTATEETVSDPALKEVKDRLDTLIAALTPPEKKGEEAAPAPEEKKDTEEAHDIVSEILSEEKLIELEETLRRSLSTDKGIDFESVKTMLDGITEEISRAFSGQPKGNG
jgi:hypothetical protein